MTTRISLIPPKNVVMPDPGLEFCVFWQTAKLAYHGPLGWYDKWRAIKHLNPAFASYCKGNYSRTEALTSLAIARVNVRV